jgi:hypothetical protein
MYCPNCKYEYIRGVTQCADCDVPLVDSLDSSESHPAENVRIFPIWRGKDAGEFERTKEALESADIPFTIPDSKSHFSFIGTEPTLEIWISDEDRAKAKKILLDLEGRADPDDLSPEEFESLALPESDAPQDDEEQMEAEPDTPGDWDEEAPVAEVWSGDKEEFANTLTACLREIGIASRKVSESGRWRLVVHPEKEARAREIVREVVEASPPE